MEQDKDLKQTRIVFKTADAGPITEAAMRDLVEWYNNAIILEPWVIAVACEFAYRFLAIHPLQDGNGRLGRGLLMLCLMQSKDDAISKVAKYLAIDRQIEKYKEEYYFILNKCSEGKFSQDAKKYKIEFFLKFMMKIIEAACNDIDLRLYCMESLSKNMARVQEQDIKLLFRSYHASVDHF